MALFKRISLFLVVNVLVVSTISLILHLFHIPAYLSSRGLNYTYLAISCLIWGMGGALISLALSRIIAKWVMGVRLIQATDSDPTHQSLLQIVQKLAREAKLSATPEVGIFNSPSPNAFATGPTQKRSLVAVSSSLLQQMTPQEIEGVLAHEISHIVNGDMVTMTLLQGIVNAFVMFLARVLAYLFSSFGKSNENRGSFMSYSLLTFLFQTIFLLLGSLVIAAFSRHREYRADFGGATLAGKEQMIGALEKLRKSLSLYQQPMQNQQSLQALMISTPQKRGFLHLFATHPPLEDRIHRLQQMK